MAASIRKVVAMVQVSDVVASIAFYANFGFSVENTFAADGAPAATWASLINGSAQLMLVKAESLVAADAQDVLFYMYFDDVGETHRELTLAGIECGAIQTPFYAPRGEFRVLDPDGYTLMLTHT